LETGRPGKKTRPRIGEHEGHLMATRGRKPTPLHLVAARGNPGKRPPPDLSMAITPPPLEQPGPPDHLSDEAKAEWGRISGALTALQMLSTLDRAALAAYCQVYGRWEQAERALAASKALTITAGNGRAIQNPLVSIANKAMAEMVRIAAEFGMTPSARTRLHAGGGAATGNPFDAFRKPPPRTTP
jgi:P27 family predicted phage terminase small subunit